MDYKRNLLTKEVVCDKKLLEDFEGLMFGSHDNQALFDATEFCLASKVDEVDYLTFSRQNKRYIEALITSGSVERGKMFYLNTNGHELIDVNLVFLYISFAVPTIFTYFNSIVGDAIAKGVAFSDGFVATLAAARIPSEILSEIINSRMSNG